MHLLGQQQQTRNPIIIFGIDLGVSPPSTSVQRAAENDLLSSLIPQQNFLIGFHMNQMLQHVEEFWRRHLSEELKKTKEIETKIKEKDQQLDLFKQLYHHYEQKTLSIEETLRRRANGEGGSKPAPTVVRHEEVQSCLVDQKNAQRMDMACKKCGSRPANMLWLPCRHLCVCFACDKRVKICPICSVKRVESFMINLP
ncbi:zinc finger, RING/FYVE/PHD-type containing protein [Tanacetum coccineum]